MVLQQTQDKGFGAFIVIQNDLIGNFINHYGYWEGHLYQFYSQLIKDTDVVLDAGANIGFHTVQFAKLAKHVYAFEPQKLIFNLLSTNILFNYVSDKVSHYRLGLGDKKTTLHMQSLETTRQANGMENYGGLGLSTSETDTQPVDLIVFDDLNIDVDVIKMDIQGSEFYALTGMKQTLLKNEPWLILENYYNQQYEQKGDKESLQLLLDMGYEVIRFMHNNNEDCFVIKPEKHKHIKDLLLNSQYTLKIEKND